MVSTYPPTRCGIAVVVQYLARNLSKLGAEVHALACTDDYVDDGGVFVHKAWRDGSATYPLSVAWSAIKVKPDVVNVHHEYLLYGGVRYAPLFPLMLVLLKFLVRKPIVLTMHSVLPLSKLDKPFFRRYTKAVALTPLLRLGIWLITKLSAKLADLVAVTLEEGKKVLVSDYGISPEKVVVVKYGNVVYDGVSPARDSPKRGKKRLVFLGLPRPGRGLFDAIKMMKYLDDCELFIVGPDHPRAQGYGLLLEKLVREEGLQDRVVFVRKYVDGEEKLKILQQADVVLVTYDEEYIIGASTALGDVSYLGKPVVSHDVYKAREDLPPELLGKPNDPASLAKAVRYALENAEEVGEALRKKALSWTWEDFAKAYRELYSAAKA